MLVTKAVPDPVAEKIRFAVSVALPSGYWVVVERTRTGTGIAVFPPHGGTPQAVKGLSRNPSENSIREAIEMLKWNLLTAPS